MQFKRKRTNGFRPRRRFNLRRRFPVRRGRFKRRGTTSTNSRSLRPSSVFAGRGRKIRPRTWRSILYKYTQPFQHYKSIYAVTGSLTTPNTTTTQSVANKDGFSSAVNEAFWQTGGGCISPQINYNPPAWTLNDVAPPPTIIIRGGRIWCQISSPPTSTEPFRIRVQLVFLKNNTRNDADTASSNTWESWVTTIGSTLTATINRTIYDMPDAQQYLYKPILDKTFDMHQSETITHYWKVKPTKVDTGAFGKGSKWFPMWWVYAYQLNNTNAATEIVTINTGHDISFSVMEGNA